MTLASLLLGFILFLVIGLLPFLGTLYLIYVLLTLPLRRNERIRLFLDLLQLGLDSGRTPERAILEAAASRDRSLGARYRLLATYLEQGLPLSEALDRVPRILPPQIRAMLKTGVAIGDIHKVLPACRLSLHSGVSQVRGALNYLLVLSFLATPFTVAIPIILKTKVVPSFRAIFADMLAGALLPGLTRVVLAGSEYLVLLQVGIMALVWLVTLGYLVGPRLRLWLGRIIPGGRTFIDWLLYRLPWRRKRLQRDFSAILAASLDAGVSEIDAVRFAGECTANKVICRRAERAGRLLAQGVKLPEAMRVLDDTGELKWRLANALRGGTGFVKALTGWHEALDAKAFQLEQAAAQTATTMLVLLNGFIVACIVIGMFLPLVEVLNQATLW